MDVADWDTVEACKHWYEGIKQSYRSSTHHIEPEATGASGIVRHSSLQLVRAASWNFKRETRPKTSVWVTNRLRLFYQVEWQSLLQHFLNLSEVPTYTPSSAWRWSRFRPHSTQWGRNGQPLEQDSDADNCPEILISVPCSWTDQLDGPAGSARA